MELEGQIDLVGIPYYFRWFSVLLLLLMFSQFSPKLPYSQ
uniref:Uncharacterized protein n=1 Tax=Anguilla anguilla TaxID=7936 RepID=A0A0E9QU54_ANGAN